MANPDVDTYAKTLNHRKIVRKSQTQKLTENQTYAKTEISLKVAVRFSHLDCQGRGNSPRCPLSVTSLL